MLNSLIDPDKIEWRDYQINLAQKALKKNCMIVLPTGLGKTVISLFVASSRLSQLDYGKALILSPTKPLVEQHS
ncbi:MAG TPA: DEAD/DEAH box helicase family protein, partial [Halobacteria archaeon]|nr:DEAD/DEAH box helicase family protein [Halobacteria archaeon]